MRPAPLNLRRFNSLLPMLNMTGRPSSDELITTHLFAAAQQIVGLPIISTASSDAFAARVGSITYHKQALGEVRLQA